MLRAVGEFGAASPRTIDKEEVWLSKWLMARQVYPQKR
jgi:hypothetical protein